MNRQAVVSAVYIQKQGVDGSCPRAFFVTLLSLEIACQVGTASFCTQLGYRGEGKRCSWKIVECRATVAVPLSICSEPGGGP